MTALTMFAVIAESRECRAKSPKCPSPLLFDVMRGRFVLGLPIHPRGRLFTQHDFPIKMGYFGCSQSVR